jgi:hypothetical protein
LQLAAYLIGRHTSTQGEKRKGRVLSADSLSFPPYGSAPRVSKIGTLIRPIQGQLTKRYLAGSPFNSKTCSKKSIGIVEATWMSTSAFCEDSLLVQGMRDGRMPLAPNSHTYLQMAAACYILPDVLACQRVCSDCLL